MSHPHVTCIVTAFLAQSKPYLDLCMASIANLDYPKEKLTTIIISPPQYRPNYPSAFSIGPDNDKYFNSHALNMGIQHASKDTDYYFLLNDDVILTKHCLKNLVISAQSINNMGIFMPIGNDNNLGKYYLSLPIPTGPYRYEQVKDIAPELMNLHSPYNNPGLIFFESLCLFAVLIPKSVIAKVGLFDESRQGQDDIDMSMRVRLAGYVNAICLRSLAFHAGGVSASVTFTDESRAESLKSFKEKWPDDPTIKS